MDLHLFCHNELPTALAALAFFAPTIAIIRKSVRDRLRQLFAR
jgi:uncharacterized membrane protein YhaH (DUF805 family)